ncbi:hypothetical protein GGR52DRAFT_526976 [Hypoxylon sp. FL1284]|nr:hypothetical protein GGR52DRAFT_526976 [Hypoxylon sp. FL1284]
MGAARAPCVMCEAIEGKYKCPHCYEYTCSLPCAKAHRKAHSSEEPAPKDPMDRVDASDFTSSTEEDSVQPDLSKRSGIADTPEYKTLVRKYPNLERLLWDIAVATDPPANNGGLPGNHGTLSASNKGRKATQPWTKDMGYENGVDVLRQARDAPGDDREALREYCELVRHYSAKRETSTTVDRANVAREDAATIKDFLKTEQKPGMP